MTHDFSQSIFLILQKKKKNSKEKVYSYGLNRHAFKIAIQKLQIILIISWKASLKWMYSYAVFKGITWEGATGGSCGTVEIWRGFSGVLLAATWEVWGWYWGNRWVAGWIGQTGWLASTCCRGVCCDMGCCQERKTEQKWVIACILWKNQFTGHSHSFLSTCLNARYITWKDKF